MIFCVIRAVVIDFQQWVILVYSYNLYICVYKHINIYIYTYICKQLGKYFDFCLSFAPKTRRPPSTVGVCSRFLSTAEFFLTAVASHLLWDQVLRLVCSERSVGCPWDNMRSFCSLLRKRRTNYLRLLTPNSSWKFVRGKLWMCCDL